MAAEGHKRRKDVVGVVEISGPYRPSNRKMSREEFAPVKGKTTERDVRKVQKIDNKNDRSLAKRYGVKFKG